MSESAPDLSRIVNLIMENPELIAQISSLAKSENEAREEPTKNEGDAEVSSYREEKATPPTPSRHTHRRELLSSLKPYLSKERQRAIDSMMTIADVLEAMKGR